MPTRCPKGTYNRKEKSTKAEDCKQCPKGTLCDRVAISNYEDHYCPPGYFCLEESYQKRPCPPGTFRPSKGASSPGPVSYGDRYNAEASCFACPAGFYCPDEAQAIPKLCEPGSYCPANSMYPISCDPGHYCIAGSAD